MSRNIYEDYIEVTGYLPKIERNRAVCWQNEQLYISGDACYEGAPKYLNAGETREYMRIRFGYLPSELLGKNFDPYTTEETVAKQVEALTISEGGRFIYLEGTPIVNIPPGITEVVYSKGEEEDRDKPSILEGFKIERDPKIPYSQSVTPGIKPINPAWIAVPLIGAIVVLGWLIFGGKP